MRKIKFDSIRFTMAIRNKRVCSSAEITGLREAAKQIGISAPTLCRVEGGNISDLMTYAKICLWLGHSLDEYIRADKVQLKKQKVL